MSTSPLSNMTLCVCGMDVCYRRISHFWLRLSPRREHDELLILENHHLDHLRTRPSEYKRLSETRNTICVDPTALHRWQVNILVWLSRIEWDHLPHVGAYARTKVFLA